MAKKKIDDEVLHKMIEEGKPQKEMAQFFRVSDAAISKRIKRLTQEEPPESFKSLSPGEKKFVLAKSEAVCPVIPISRRLSMTLCTRKASAGGEGSKGYGMLSSQKTWGSFPVAWIWQTN